MDTFIHSSETLCSMEFSLNDRQNELVTDISGKVNNTLTDIPFFLGQPEDVMEHARFVILSVVKYLINQFSLGHDEMSGERFVFPISGGHDTMFLYTQTTETIVGLLYVYVVRNLVEFGLFTEYWSQIKVNMAFAVACPFDVFLHTELSFDDYRDILDRSFEASLQETQEKIYGEHHNHKLSF